MLNQCVVTGSDLIRILAGPPSRIVGADHECDDVRLCRSHPTVDAARNIANRESGVSLVISIRDARVLVRLSANVADATVVLLKAGIQVIAVAAVHTERDRIAQWHDAGAALQLGTRSRTRNWTRSWNRHGSRNGRRGRRCIPVNQYNVIDIEGEIRCAVILNQDFSEISVQ